MDEQPDRWPHAAPELGVIYGFTDPTWQQQMVAMTLETWKAILKDVETMKSRLDVLSEENILMKQGVVPGEKKLVLPS